MKICLVFPKTTFFEDPMVFPPLGLFYIKAVLESDGHDVDYVDMSEYEVDSDGNRRDIFSNLDSLPKEYDLYMVSGSSPQASEIRKIGKYLKDQGCTTIAGGPHVSNYAGSPTMKVDSNVSVESLPVDEELVANYHVLVKFEGERSVLEAIQRVDEGREYMDKFGRGIVIQHPNIPVPEMGEIPIPSRTDAHKYNYHLADENGVLHRGTTMFTSRGCPERCAFCDSPGLWGRGVRYTPINRVVEELDQIRELGFSAIQFYDDILPLDKKRMIEVCKELKKREFIWRCFLRVDIMSHPNYGKEFIQMMYDSGLREVLVGVESGSQKILDGIHKGTTVEQNTKVREWCKDIGVRFKASVILGLPGETKETMDMTRQWVLNNKPDKVNVCIFIPFTGTPIAKTTEEWRARQYGKDVLHEYDIDWDMDAALLEQEFYAGSRTGLKALIHTSSLTSKQIEDFYHEFIDDLDKIGLSY